MAIPCLKLPKLSIQLQIKKSVEGLLGIRTLGCNIIGADVSSEIWRDAQELVYKEVKVLPCSQQPFQDCPRVLLLLFRDLPPT